MSEPRISVACELEASPRGYVVTATIEQDGKIVSEAIKLFPTFAEALASRGDILTRWARTSYREARQESRR